MRHVAYALCYPCPPCCSSLQRLHIHDTRLDAASVNRLTPLARLTELALSRESWAGDVGRVLGRPRSWAVLSKLRLTSSTPAPSMSLEPCLLVTQQNGILGWADVCSTPGLPAPPCRVRHLQPASRALPAWPGGAVHSCQRLPAQLEPIPPSVLGAAAQLTSLTVSLDAGVAELEGQWPQAEVRFGVCPGWLTPWIPSCNGANSSTLPRKARRGNP